MSLPHTVFFSVDYIIRLFWSKTGNDTAIYKPLNGYILLKVIPQGNLIIKDAEFENFSFKKFNIKPNFVSESWNITKAKV